MSGFWTCNHSVYRINSDRILNKSGFRMFGFWTSIVLGKADKIFMAEIYSQEMSGGLSAKSKAPNWPFSGRMNFEIDIRLYLT